MDANAVSGQNPFERVIEKTFHGARLFAPVIPTPASIGREVIAVHIPAQMIAGEQIAFAVQEADGSTRMAWNWNNGDIVVQLNRLVGFDLDLGVTDHLVGGMDQAPAAEFSREARMIGDVVAMGTVAELAARQARGASVVIDLGVPDDPEAAATRLAVPRTTTGCGTTSARTMSTVATVRSSLLNF